MPSLPDLPTELLMEIVKYYPELYLDLDACIRGVPRDQYSGHDSLRALSQTSRVLRDIFLPLLWARMHACFTPRNRPKRKIRTRAKMLERRMIGIEKTPYVAPYIRSLCITMMECSMLNWQPIAAFVRVLDLLPNLRELTILHLVAEMAPVVHQSCSGKVFPSVLRLALPDRLGSLIIHCFPNVQNLTFHHWSDSIAILKAVNGKFEHIHTLNNMRLSTQSVECLRDAIPNVKRLSIWRYLQLDTLRLLEGMDNLSELQIRLRPVGEPPLDDVVATAQRVLRTSKVRGCKELRIQELEAGAEDVFQKETVIVVR
ncbi:hypothetical protein B0H19DRAFT_1262634 [Mycena capillaripes]|nr:hypothetical protein B0H19DRAFT_1262634 [Mycena capillaripes]